MNKTLSDKLFSETQGDLFDYVLDPNNTNHIMIPHVCNNMQAWGAGFVLPLAKHFPKTKEQYLQIEDIEIKLGYTQYVVNRPSDKRTIVVANMIAQTLGGTRPLYYNKLVNCMEDVAAKFKNSNLHEIVCPRFGSALAGGDWNFIKELIYDCWIRRGITVKVFYL